MSDHNREEVLRSLHRHSGELHQFLMGKLRCREDASDVLQEMYVRMLTLLNPKQIREPRAFLYKTAVNLALDTLRKHQVRAAHHIDLEDSEHVLSMEPDQESMVESKQRLKILQEAIAELPPKCRHVFLLHKFKNFSHAEIAAQLGISKNMVEKHVIKAMAYCRKRMDESV